MNNCSFGCDKQKVKCDNSSRYLEMNFMYNRTCSIVVCCITVMLFACSRGKRNSTATTAFYYWKTNFKLDAGQAALVKQAGSNKIYVRFFDVNWDKGQHRAYPNAVIQFNNTPAGLNIIPVIYITNTTFENMADTAINSLAINCNKLLGSLAAEQHLSYAKVQVDCDWTLTTRQRYFNFLLAFKKLNHLELQATIRLHQVKFKERTGVPPVDKGVLMFYNMGKLNPNLQQPNSIYNDADAEKYIPYLTLYPLKMDVALPLFSWAIHIREGRVIQVYGKIGHPQLNNRDDFEPTYGENNYRAKHSFFLTGIYIKQNDIFKLEQTTAAGLNTAAKQLVKYLPQQPGRTIIYYELANINLSEYQAETIRQVSDRF